MPTDSKLSVRHSLLSTPVIDDAKGGYRKRIVILISMIYWLVIFEGVLRKWVVPEWGRPLFFIKDPLVILVYLISLRYRAMPRQSPFLVIGLLFAVISVPLAAVQYFFSTSEFNWGIAAYGWRNYFLYVPLAFFVAEYMPVSSIQRLMRWTLMFSIPIAVLVFLQVRAPASAPINQGIGKTSELQYANGGVANGVVRTYGTFTSSTGQQAFIVSSMAMLLAAWMLPKSKRPVKGLALLGATAAIVSCLALSGSRGSMIWSGLVLVAAFTSALTWSGRHFKLRLVAVPATLVLASILVVPLAFPEAIRAFVDRWSRADIKETQSYGSGGVFARAVYELFSFKILLADTPLSGYQLGAFGNAAFHSSASSERTPLSTEQTGAAESDWGRNILELGPVFGLLFIIFRVAFVVWLAREAIAATRRSGQPLPVLMFAFVGVLLFNGQITGNGTLNGYGWLFVGFLLAICDQIRPHRLSNELTMIPFHLIQKRAPHLQRLGV